MDSPTPRTTRTRCRARGHPGRRRRSTLAQRMRGLKRGAQCARPSQSRVAWRALAPACPANPDGGSAGQWAAGRRGATRAADMSRVQKSSQQPPASASATGTAQHSGGRPVLQQASCARACAIHRLPLLPPRTHCTSVAHRRNGEALKAIPSHADNAVCLSLHARQRRPTAAQEFPGD